MTPAEEKLYWDGFARAACEVFGANGIGRLLIALIRHAPEGITHETVGFTKDSMQVLISRLREAMFHSGVCPDAVKTECAPRVATTYRISEADGRLLREFIENA